ncbi:hypothetical protein GP2143_07539 [marine gamma proteobacterium HTCC2143]|uniref:Uncharacterized protein n=1 Tax=marine gamma proteobacterium HTCC2143 TaxID=247633 RepID=A0YC65_9GAMM|nr:hypothetical protein GP2143_07539 [marine gamma proteobacterium HTCC2143]
MPEDKMKPESSQMNQDNRTVKQVGLVIAILTGIACVLMIAVAIIT